MIRSFADKETEKVFQRYFSRKLPPEIQHTARVKLEILDAVEVLHDLRIPPPTTWKNCRGIGLISTVSVLTSSGGFVLSGAKVTLIKLRLLIIMGRFMSKERLPPIHPGEILLEEFLKPLGLSQYRLAKEINVTARRINEIVLGKRAISPDTALRLSRYFGLSERFWMNLQARYDLEVEKDRLQDRLEKEVLVYTATS